MHELFLTAFVEADDLPTALSILSGLTGQPPWTSLSRVLYFQGPPRNPGAPSNAAVGGIKNDANIEALQARPPRKEAVWLWSELKQSLARQSYILQVRYDVDRERDMVGEDASESESMMGNLDAAPGVLRWTDFPVPGGQRPVVQQRKKVEIWEQKKMPTVMRDNQYQFKTEVLEETHRFFRDELEFSLHRPLFLHPIQRYTAVAMPSANEPSGPPQPLASLPAFDALTPADAQNRWTLSIRTHVLRDNVPEEVKKATEALMKVRGELEEVFDFKVLDRKVFDTRVMAAAQGSGGGVQVLPQRVTLGKK